MASKVSMTFRINEELAKRVRDDAAKSGGRLTQVDLIEKALEDRYAVKDGAKVLERVRTSQQETLTKIETQTQSIAAWQEAINALVERLEQREALVADARTVERDARKAMLDMADQLRQFKTTMNNVDTALEHAAAAMAQSAEQRLGVLSLVGMAGFVCLALIGAVSAVSMVVRVL